MANRVHTDPEHIRQFATDLSGFRERVTELTDQVHGQLATLGDTWQDEAYQQFCEVFAGARHRIAKFSQEVEQVLPELRRDAQRAEAYQNEKLSDFG